MIRMDGDLVVDSTSQLIRTRRLATVLVIQPSKKYKVMENLDSFKGM